MAINDEDFDSFDLDSFELLPVNFDSTFSDKFHKSFAMSHVNVRSLYKNIESVRLLYEESIKSEFHVIGLSEVWSVPDTDILGINGYNLEVSCRGPEMRGGGVGVYVHSLIKYKMLSYLA